MEIYTPRTDLYHTTAELPQDLVDKRTAASVRVGIEAALDNAAHLKTRHDFTSIKTGKQIQGQIPDSPHGLDYITVYTPTTLNWRPLQIFVNDVVAGDIVDVTVVFFAQSGGGDISYEFELQLADETLHNVVIPGKTSTFVVLTAGVVATETPANGVYRFDVKARCDKDHNDVTIPGSIMTKVMRYRP